MKVADRKLVRTSRRRNASEKEGQAAEGRNLAALYFRDIGTQDLLSRKEEIGLAKRIDGHIGVCVETLLLLLGTAREILRRPRGRRLPKFLRERKSFVGHPFVAEHLKRSRFEGDAALRSAARRLVFIVRPGEAEGKALEAVVTKTVRDQKCGWYLETFASREAKRDFDEMVSRNLRLVITIAKRYLGRGMSLTDLIQEGNLGLIKAVSRFDQSRGFRFSTYATWWIKHAVGRAIADKAYEVRIPVHAIDLHSRINRTERELGTRLGRNPTVEELAKELDVPVGKLRPRLNDLRKRVSLDAPPPGKAKDSETNLEAVFRPPGEEPHPSDPIISEEEARFLREAMACLTDIERDTLTRRFGLDDDVTETLNQIAKDYGLSRERIRQIQEKALLKLRRRLERRLA